MSSRGFHLKVISGVYQGVSTVELDNLAAETVSTTLTVFFFPLHCADAL